MVFVCTTTCLIQGHGGQLTQALGNRCVLNANTNMVPSPSLVSQRPAPQRLPSVVYQLIVTLPLLLLLLPRSLR